VGGLWFRNDRACWGISITVIRAFYGNVPLIGRVSFTLRQGIAPSTGAIAFPAGVNLPVVADLRLNDGDREIVINDLYLVDPVEAWSESGQIVQATIADKRWLWKYGAISGSYNVPSDYGVPVQEQTLKQLITTCLSGLTVNYFHVVDNVYPTVEWDYDSPAEAVQALCHQYGLAVCVSLNGQIWIAPETEERPDVEIGIGEIAKEITFQTPDTPASINVIGNPIINQETFECYAVGIERFDHGTYPNKLRPIADLSYKPAEGWGKSILIDFEDITNILHKKLAKQCIYRYFSKSCHV